MTNSLTFWRAVLVGAVYLAGSIAVGYGLYRLLRWVA